MIPSSISFVGNTVTVTYPANPKRQSRFWWDSAVFHEFIHHPKLTSIESILCHEAKTRKMKRARRAKLISEAPVKACGRGKLLFLHPHFMHKIEGRARTGTTAPMFLLSPRGRRGTLELRSSSYHKYNEDDVQIGTSRQWPELPTPDVDPAEVELIQLPIVE